MGTQISARGPVDDFLYGAHLYPITTVGDRTLWDIWDIPLTTFSISESCYVPRYHSKTRPTSYCSDFILNETPKHMQISLKKKGYLKCDLCGYVNFVWRIGRIPKAFYDTGEAKGVKKGGKTCCERRTSSIWLVLLLNEVSNPVHLTTE